MTEPLSKLTDRTNEPQTNQTTTVSFAAHTLHAPRDTVRLVIFEGLKFRAVGVTALFDFVACNTGLFSSHFVLNICLLR